MKSVGLSMTSGAVLLAIWAAVLIVSITAVHVLPNPDILLSMWEVFYRIGSIIYGGGQVVLPMLFTELVKQQCDDSGSSCRDDPDTWVTSKQFYAGLGIVQVSDSCVMPALPIVRTTEELSCLCYLSK